METEDLKVRRINLNRDDITTAIKEFIEKYHQPEMVFHGDEEIDVKHQLGPNDQYLGARVEIAHKFIKLAETEAPQEDLAGEEEELEEHIKESSEVGEPIHPDQMMKDLVSGKAP